MVLFGVQCGLVWSTVWFTVGCTLWFTLYSLVYTVLYAVWWSLTGHTLWPAGEVTDWSRAVVCGLQQGSSVHQSSGFVSSVHQVCGFIFILACHKFLWMMVEALYFYHYCVWLYRYDCCKKNYFKPFPHFASPFLVNNGKSRFLKQEKK